MLAILLNITGWLEAHQLPCMFKSITHFDCPGCGIQRSFVLLLKGDFAGSMVMYPALIPILLLLLLLPIHLIKNIKNGAAILKYVSLFCTALIMVSYIYKLIVTNY